MKKTPLFALALAVATAGYAATQTPTADTWLQNGSTANNSGTDLRVKNQNNQQNDRVTFIRFDGAAIRGNVASPTLTLSVASYSSPASALTVQLFGISDGAQSENFDPATLTFANSGYTDQSVDNNVNDALFWGGAPVATAILYNTNSAAGSTLVFSGGNLAAFLNANTNDTIAFVVTSATINDSMFLAFASMENATHPKPTLQYTEPPLVPEMVGHPVSQTNYAGSTVQMSAAAVGVAPMTYQWKAGPIGGGFYTNLVEGGSYSGVNSSILTINPVTAANAGDYILVATNPNGSVTSDPATLSVYTASIAGPNPGSSIVYPGANVSFNVTAVGASPITYQWRKNGSPLSDSATVSGATSANLTLTSVSAADAATYTVVVTTPYGSVTSSAADLALTDAPAPGSYAERVFTNRPVAYWRLNEQSGSNAYDYAGGRVALYGPSSLTGGFGPASPEFPGIEPSNTAVTTTYSLQDSAVVMPASTALNLNTNTLTIAAWVYPVGLITVNSGIVVHRNGGDFASLQINPNGYLGYNWNNDSGTYGWNSMLTLPTDQWSFVALTVTPTNATVYMYNSYGQLSASQTRNHANAPLKGVLTIGDDPASGSNGGRTFNGSIDEVALFDRALSSTEISSLYFTALGQDQFAPTISTHPVSLNLYEQQTATFTVQASATPAPSYQWKKWTGFGFENVVNGGRISGATSATLTISNITLADTGDYLVSVSNPLGAVDSNPGTLVVQTAGNPENITMSVVQSGGQSWETADSWSDLLPASQSAVAKPGSTYTILPSAGMRTPYNVASATFPGNELRVQGNGVFTTSIAGSGIGAVILKSANWGTVTFNRLVMEGGEILNFVDGGGSTVLAGEVNVLGNTPIHCPDDTSERSIRLDAKLTGNGSIEFRGYPGTSFRPAAVSSLNIANANNTFSGTWNVIAGTLLGSAPNSLGTNSIVIGAGGALQASYPMNNPGASLVLDGRFNLTQNHTFKSVVVGGVPLAPGTYTYAQLSVIDSSRFPATWTGVAGAETLTNASGSITVLSEAAPMITGNPTSQTVYVGQSVTLTASAAGNNLSYQWMFSNGGAFAPVANGNGISGATTATLVIASVQTSHAGNYRLQVSNGSGTVTSAAAQLTVEPTQPAAEITMSVLQSAGMDWDTAASWSDSMSASLSAVAKPGSTYRILPNAGMRTPANSASATFPGETLVVEGNGTISSTLGAGDIGSLMIKGASSGSGSTVHFNKLVMAGGQLANIVNSGGSATLTGEMNVIANTPVWAAEDTKARTITIASKITGNGNIEYHAHPTSPTFRPENVASLHISGSENTYSGTWKVVLGTLVASGANSLGTNTITVGVEGALQATYNINSPDADLVLDGRLYLTGNHVFRSVVVNGTPLSAGTYTFSQLNAAYPSNFPATWVGQPGAETLTSASGTLSVGGASQPPTLGFGVSSTGGLTLQWSQGVLVESTSPNGPWTPNNSAQSPYVVPVDGVQKFFRIMIP